MPTEPTPLSIPRQAFGGLAALVKLGKIAVEALCQQQATAPLDLSFSKIFHDLSLQLGSTEDEIEKVFMQALIPLNGLRKSLGMPASDFVDSLATTVEKRAPKEWKEQYLKGWKEILPSLGPLFEPDNFFSQTSKALELLSLRPAVLHSARIISELRPVFDEDTTKTLAVLQTNTLVIRYWDGESVCSKHLTLDDGDLDNLVDEIERAKQKILVATTEAMQLGTRLVTYGGQFDDSDT